MFHSRSPNYSLAWIPWNLSFRYILFHEKRLQTMLWHHNAKVNSHQRWKQTRFRVCFHLWCELTNTMNVTEWQFLWNSCFEYQWLPSKDFFLAILSLKLACSIVIHALYCLFQVSFSTFYEGGIGKAINFLPSCPLCVF